MKKTIVMLLFLVPTFFYTACQPDDNDLCMAELQADCICYEIYDPVCGCDGVTYSNDCFAECNGIENYTPGPCDQ